MTPQVATGAKIQRLADLCTVVRGSSPRPKGDPRYFGGPIPWISIADVTAAEGKYLERTKEGVTAAGAGKSRLLAAGTLIVSNSATICVPKILRCDGCIHDGFVALLDLHPGVDIDYLYHYFNAVRDEVRAKNKQGVTQVNLNTDIFKNFEVPLPPLPEQRRIAAILDHADALRAKRRTVIAKLDSLTQSMFLDMFGGPDSARWPKAPLSELASSIRTGPFGSQLLHSEFVESGVAVLGIDNVVQNSFTWAKPRFITERKFQSLKRYAVSPADVLITIMATCGRCAIVPDNIGRAINTKHICCISLDQAKCLPAYLHACFLRHPDILRQLGVRERGAVMPGLNMQLIKELLIPLPPRTTQSRWKAEVEKITALSAEQSDSMAQLDSMFASLQYRAFRGEL